MKYNILLLLNINSGNLGDDFISATLLQHYKGLSKDVICQDVVFYRGYRNKVLGLLLGFFKTLFNFIKSKRIVAAGGNLLLPSSTQFLLSLFVFVSFKLLLFKRLEIHYVGVSKFRGDFKSWLMSKLLLCVDEITVRDNSSAINLFEATGIKSEVIADAAFLCPSVAVDENKVNVVGFVPICYHAVNLHHDFYKKTVSDYENDNLSAINKFKEDGFTVKIYVTDRVDFEFAKQLSVLADVEFLDIQDLTELKEVVSNSIDIVVATRMHAVIMAVLLGKIVVSIVWNEKVAALHEELNASYPLVSLDHIDDISIKDIIFDVDWISVENIIKSKRELLDKFIRNWFGLNFR